MIIRLMLLSVTETIYLFTPRPFFVPEQMMKFVAYWRMKSGISKAVIFSDRSSAYKRCKISVWHLWRQLLLSEQLPAEATSPLPLLSVLKVLYSISL